jgi:hypothetical protein
VTVSVLHRRLNPLALRCLYSFHTWRSFEVLRFQCLALAAPLLTPHCNIRYIRLGLTSRFPHFTSFLASFLSSSLVPDSGCIHIFPFYRFLPYYFWVNHFLYFSSFLLPNSSFSTFLLIISLFSFVHIFFFHSSSLFTSLSYYPSSGYVQNTFSHVLTNCTLSSKFRGF